MRVLARTTGSGRFEVAVADGSVDLEVTHPRWRKATRNVRADEGVVDVELSEGSKLKLLAVSDDGEPVAGAAVSVILAGRPRECQTDATGRCEVAFTSPVVGSTLKRRPSALSSPITA